MQLKIVDTQCLIHYCKRQTWWDHITEICRFEGYLNFWAQPTHWRLTRWLYNRTWFSDESLHGLFDQTTIYLVEHKILLPGVTVLERTIANIRERVQQKLWHRIAQRLSRQQRQQLIELLRVDAQTQRTPLEQLRRPPTRRTSAALVEALQRFVQVQQWQIHLLNFSKIPPSRIQALSRPAFTYRAQSLARLPEHRQLATLVAFAYVLEATAQDDVLDVLELRVKELLAKSERDGKQQRLRTLKDLDSATLQLS